MTDPLSISCAIATLANVAAKLASYGKEILVAPKEILLLSSEATSLSRFVTKLEDAQIGDDIIREWHHELRHILSPLQLKSTELSNFVDTLNGPAGSVSFKERMKWPLLRPKAQALSYELREIRLNVIAYLSIHSS
jgi:hypothetical protein